MSDETWGDVMEKTKQRHSLPPSDKVIPLHPLETEEDLPDTSTPYRAAGMAATHGTLPSLTVILGAAEFRDGGTPYHYFQYVHLDSDSGLSFTKNGQVITLRFIAFRPVELTITGRNLVRLSRKIHNHRIPWIRMADRDFTPADEVAGNEPIVTGIRIEPLVNEPR